MSEADPITKVYEALWTLLEAHDGFTSRVAAGNRVKFNGSNRDPIKDQVSTADLPEVRIVPISTEPHMQRTSNGSSIRKRFGIEVSTGDQRVDAELFPLEWEIYRALAQWVGTLSALKWNDKTFVKLCSPLEIVEGVSDSDLNRGIVGWSLVWACEVEMWFTTADLAEVE